MAPTAASKSSAKTNEFGTAAPRCWRGFWASCAAASRSALAMACSLNSSTAGRHLAEFIPAPEARQHDIDIAAGEFAHGLAHCGHGSGNSLPSNTANTPPSRKPPAASMAIKTLGLANARIGLGFKSLLIGKQSRPSSRLNLA